MNVDVLDNRPVMTSRGSNRVDEINRISGDLINTINSI